ncbi:MAG: nucleoside recognition domain-containing protein [Candidatus Kapaibacterium sp.]
MLNWIWLGLIVIAITVATGRDISEISSDRFRNDLAIPLIVASDKLTSPDHFNADAIILRSTLQRFYDASEVASLKADTIHLSVDHAASSAGSFSLPADAIKIWQDMAAAQGDEKKVVGKISIREGQLFFTPEPVKFRILAKVANDGLLKTADTAVTIVLGLIGIMALWLGIMKIAEAAGLITLLAKFAKPVMVRLFPDVPPEHPAMGAMLSNMAANFLGLSNAATPLGLKAMEELNKLNPNAGTATNAMCMFLTINTSAITLIPATVIAIRVSLGSKNPTDIIIPTFIATLVALICGVIFNRLIQRFFPIKEGNA